MSETEHDLIEAALAWHRAGETEREDAELNLAWGCAHLLWERGEIVLTNCPEPCELCGTARMEAV